jgi:hypothetical protein
MISNSGDGHSSPRSSEYAGRGACLSTGTYCNNNLVPLLAIRPSSLAAVQPGRLNPTPSRPGLHPTAYRGTFRGQVRDLNGCLSRWSVSFPLVQKPAKPSSVFRPIRLLLWCVAHVEQLTEGVKVWRTQTRGISNP